MAAVDGFETVTITSSSGRVRARFVPDANLLCDSLTVGGAELLHPGRGVRAYAERGKTMGIPLLHPWANRLAAPQYTAAGATVDLPAPEGRYPTDPNGLPIHGALPGLLRWKARGIAADVVDAVLDWNTDPLLELFPYEHQLQCTAAVSDAGLELTTTLVATGDDPVPVSFGYHPYLVAPGEQPRADWQVSLGATELVVTDDRMIPTGERRPLAPTVFALEQTSWDDGLAGLGEPAGFSVRAGETTVSAVFEEGYAFAQVYAPPGERFICFEPMTAPTDALRSGEALPVVTPGGRYRARWRVAVAAGERPTT